MLLVCLIEIFLLDFFNGARNSRLLMNRLVYLAIATLSYLVTNDIYLSDILLIYLNYYFLSVNFYLS